MFSYPPIEYKVAVPNPPFRLGTESGVAVSTSDRTAQGTLYLNGIGAGDYMLLFNGTTWYPYYVGPYVSKAISFETRASLSGTTTSGSAVVTGISSTTGLVKGDPISGTGVPSSTVIRTVDSGTQITMTNNATASGSPTLTFYKSTYDVFAIPSGANVDLEYSAGWTDNTTRADSLTTQDGRYVKSGSPSRLWLGTIRGDGQNTIADSKAKRFCWNFYNQVPRTLEKLEDENTWTYGTNAYRAANGNADNRVEIVSGLAGRNFLDLWASHTMQHGTAGQPGYIAIGEDDSTTVVTDMDVLQLIGAGTSINASGKCRVLRYPSAGWHSYLWLERGAGSGANIWYGDGGAPTLIRNGLRGTIMG